MLAITGSFLEFQSFLASKSRLRRIYTPGWRERLRVKRLAQEHNTMTPARAQAQTFQQCTKHKTQ